jgi:hypothetical protein
VFAFRLVLQGDRSGAENENGAAIAGLIRGRAEFAWCVFEYRYEIAVTSLS